MFLLDWLWYTLSVLGLYQKSGKLILLGLDDAGKTTLLHMLRNNLLSVHYPTQKPTMEEVNIGSVKFRAYDMGGHAQARRIWRDYLPDVDAVVFLIDSSNPSRFEESRKELNGLLEMSELRDVPIAILANKVDKQGCASEQYMRDYFSVSPYYGGSFAAGAKKIELFMCSIVNRQGYDNAFKWISKFM